MPIELSATDVAAAEEFLASVVSEQVPDGRYTDGTALRDLTIKALAVIAAQLRKENNTVQALQSLTRIRQLAGNTAEANLDPAVADATDALLSNWFIQRRGGSYARGVVQVFVSRRQDYSLPRTSRFIYDRVHGFYPDSTTDMTIPAASLTPNIDSNGVVISYSFNLRLVAAETGEGFNVFPGTWGGTGGFSPFVMRVVSTVRFEGGKPRQSTVNMIDEAKNAIAVRNLINDRSIQATLSQTFTYVSRMTNIGMGDPEMQRDKVLELASGVRAHIGGCFDIYAELAPAETVYEGIIGGAYTRPDGIINVFDDPAVTDWTTVGVLVGDVLHITAGLPDVPRDYVITGVTTDLLYVAEQRPFTAAVSGIQYYIYRPMFGPDVQIYPTSGSGLNGFTSAIVTTPNRVVLPAEPHYDIIDVAIVNPGADPYVNDPDGLVHFTQRINDTPVMPSDPLSPAPFQLIGRNPANGQSARCFDELVIPQGYNGKRVRIKYQSLAGFSAIDSYVRDRYQRVLAASVQLKGFHPVYLQFTVGYRLSPLATSTIDELRIRQNLVAFINNFDPRDVIDASDIAAYVRNIERNIGTLFAFTINYTLLAPDGRAVAYTTSDIVTISPTKYAAGSTVQPTTDELLQLTVSDRTVRYMTRLELIHMEAR